MASFETAKRSFAAYKGHYTRSLKSFNALLDVKPFPTLSSIENSYTRLQKRIDAHFNSTESMISLLKEANVAAEVVDDGKELETVNQYYDTLISEQTKVETKYAKFKEVYVKNTCVQVPNHHLHGTE